jgi:hypothetical protein
MPSFVLRIGFLLRGKQLSIISDAISRVRMALTLAEESREFNDYPDQ